MLGLRQDQEYYIPCFKQIWDLTAFIAYLEGLYPNVRQLNSQQLRKRRLINDIYIPILKDNGRVPQNMDFAGLCASLNINQHHISHNISQLYFSMDKYLNTQQAAEYLVLSPRTVQHLAASGLLPAKKVGAKWTFTTTMLNNYLRQHGYTQ